MRQRDIVRAIYLYLVTATGIILALTGIIGTLTGILNMYVFRLVPPASAQSALESLLRFASCTAVGIPVWSYHWKIIQEARHNAPLSAVPDAGTDHGNPTMQTESRHDLIRRLYIYLLSAIGLGIVIINLINSVPTLYRVFWISSASTGTPAVPGIRGSVYDAQRLIRIVVAILIGTPVWLYHWHLGQREYKKPVGE